MTTYHRIIKEDGEVVPTNNAGGGNVAGIGVPNSKLPNQDEPGFKKKTLKAILKRKPPNIDGKL
jgi:hypothetical protein